MQHETYQRAPVTPHELLMRHFGEIGARLDRETPSPRQPGDVSGVHIIRVDGVDLIAWAAAKADEALRAGAESALAELLGKHEPWPHHLGIKRAEPWCF